MKTIISFFLTVAIVASFNSAHAGQIYTSHDLHTRLAKIDTVTGTVTDIGSFEQPGRRLPSGVFDNQGQFYSTALTADFTDSQLARVDITTGVATLVGAPAGALLVPLEVDANNTMYTMRHVVSEAGLGGDPELFTIDTTTGQTTAVGNTGVERAMDLAFDSHGTLWLVGGTDGGNRLYTLDTTTGESTFAAQLTGVEEATEENAEIMGIMFDENDTLFGTAYFEGNPDFVSPLFTIDTATGATTVVGTTGLILPHGGAYLVPEPSSMALLLAGGLLVVTMRVRTLGDGSRP